MAHPSTELRKRLTSEYSDNPRIPEHDQDSRTICSQHGSPRAQEWTVLTSNEEKTGQQEMMNPGSSTSSMGPSPGEDGPDQNTANREEHLMTPSSSTTPRDHSGRTGAVHPSRMGKTLPVLHLIPNAPKAIG